MIDAFTRDPQLSESTKSDKARKFMTSLLTYFTLPGGECFNYEHRSKHLNILMYFWCFSVLFSDGTQLCTFTIYTYIYIYYVYQIPLNNSPHSKLCTKYKCLMHS
jgi:hypothetical protein